MSETSHFVTLASNTKTDYYTQNRAHSFVNTLEQPLDLSYGLWEVALLDIQIPENWVNVHTTDLVIKLELAENSWDVKENTGGHFFMQDYYRTEALIDEITQNSVYHITLPKGHYESVESLVHELNTTVRTRFQPVDITNSQWNFMVFDRVKNQVAVCKNAWWIIKYTFYSCPISEILGFTKKGASENWVVQRGHGTVNSFKPVYAPYYPDITNGRNTMFVYADCLDVQNVGDTVAPLLYKMPSRLTNGLLVIDKPQYKPVSKKMLTSIEIELRDQSGEYFHFPRGVTFCTLHFRRRV